MTQPQIRSIVVSAFCQTAGIGAALRVLFPGAEVHLDPIVDDRVQSKRLVRRLKAADAWIHCPSEDSAGWASRARSMRRLRYLRVPLLEFRAFQPDMCTAYDVVSDVTARQKYSSRIGVWAYHRRIPPAEAARYFNERVFGNLGYFDCWNDSASALRSDFEASDLAGRFEAFYRRVKRTGQFMHTTTHPTATPLTLLAKLAAMELGAPDSVFDQQVIAADLLAYLRWPVYPEIALHLSIPTTGYVWKMQQATLEEDVVVEGPERFLKYCFDHYQKQGISPENARIRGVDLAQLERRITA